MHGRRGLPDAADEIQPVANETRDRIITGTVTVVPFLALGSGVLAAVGAALNWHDIVVFLIVYMATGLGVTVGFHRLLTHRSFKTKTLAARHVRGARLGCHRGTGDLLGRRSPQAPRLRRPGG